MKEPAGVLRKTENSAVTPVRQCRWLASWCLGNFPSCSQTDRFRPPPAPPPRLAQAQNRSWTWAPWGEGTGLETHVLMEPLLPVLPPGAALPGPSLSPFARVPAATESDSMWLCGQPCPRVALQTAPPPRQQRANELPSLVPSSRYALGVTCRLGEGALGDLPLPRTSLVGFGDTPKISHSHRGTFGPLTWVSLNLILTNSEGQREMSSLGSAGQAFASGWPRSGMGGWGRAGDPGAPQPALPPALGLHMPPPMGLAAFAGSQPERLNRLGDGDPGRSVAEV